METDPTGIHPLFALQRYACTDDPSALPNHILKEFTDTTLTLYDCFPKSKIHLLVLPRPHAGVKKEDLWSLRTLLKGDKDRAKQVLEDMGKTAAKVKDGIEKDMVEKWGVKWPVWVGFHAISSMQSVSLSISHVRALTAY